MLAAIKSRHKDSELSMNINGRVGFAVSSRELRLASSSAALSAPRCLGSLLMRRHLQGFYM